LIDLRFADAAEQVRRHFGCPTQCATKRRLVKRLDDQETGKYPVVFSHALLHCRHGGSGEIGHANLDCGNPVERDDRIGKPLRALHGDIRNKPNPCLRRIGPGPYFAVAVWPSDLASSAGPSIDVNGRVLTSEQQPIPDLYAVGADAASIFRGTYPGPGTMIGPAMVFAWRAAMDIAGKLGAASL
jgi:FAD binding domain